MTQAGDQELIGKYRTGLLLLVLLALFVVAALCSEQAGQAIVAKTAASSLNNRPQGTKALYRLFGTLPCAVHRLTDPWTTLTDRDGLLIASEKFAADRQPTGVEVGALAAWTRQGGTVLYFVEEPARPLDAGDPLAGDIAILDGNDKPLAVAPLIASPLTRQVESIAVSSKVRLQPAPGSPWQVLFADRYGAIVAQKPLGKGRVILAADPLLISNQGVPQADNVVFLANALQYATGQNKRAVAFDEYHHGVGFETGAAASENWISVLPRPLKRAAWAGIVLLLLLVYNGNRRFGAARVVPVSTHRAGTDYVHSLALWYRRAEAADIAVEILFNDLLRHAARHLDLPPDADAQAVQQQFERREPDDAATFAQIAQDSRQIIAARHAAPDTLLDVTRRIELFKRTLLRKA